jgi:hypothetical protein
MNPGMAIFRKYQRFQRGTNEVPPFPADPPWPAEFDELMERLRRREIREPYPKEGKRKKFNPRDVPIMDTDIGRAFDPTSLGNAFMLQGGESDVRYTPVTPTEEYPYSTDYEFIHRKEPNQSQAELDLQQDIKQADEEQKLLLDQLGITKEDLNMMNSVPPEEWPQLIRDKIPDDSTGEKIAAELGYARGTSNVNPGLLLFRKKLLKKPKL